MSDELITDDELITAVKESVTDVHMTIPAEQITSRSRAMRARRRIPGLAGALAVIAAVAVAVTILPGHRANSAAPLSVKLLADRAAAAALSWPSVEPGQWVYREIKYRTPAGDGTALTWITAAGTLGRIEPSSFGFFYRDTISYSELGSLPSDPAALEEYLGDHRLHSVMAEPEHAGTTFQPMAAPGTAFDQIYGVLWEYVPPPKLAAELFHALADVPGITVRPHVTDVAGQPGVAFVLPSAEISAGRFKGGRWTVKSSQELILNPSHYTLMAVGETSTLSVQKRPHGPVAITRSQTFQRAIVRQAFVSRPGVRP